jgi:hypothetical protein
MDADRVHLDSATTQLVQSLAQEKLGNQHAATILTIERLRRLEDLARCGGGSRQDLQRIMSARRILGDRADLGPSETNIRKNEHLRPTPDLLRVS